MPTIAFAGVGHIHTPGFINMLSRRGSFKVKKVWDHNLARGKQRAGEVKGEFVEKLDDIANDPEITGVVVCSETDRHQPVVELLAAHGKHLFVEKPLGLGATDAYEMAEAIERRGRALSDRLLYAKPAGDPHVAAARWRRVLRQGHARSRLQRTQRRARRLVRLEAE